MRFHAVKSDKAAQDAGLGWTMMSANALDGYAMSRAFVKENDGDGPDELPELPLSPHPNQMTPRGLRLLQERLVMAQAQRAVIDESAVGAVQQRAYLARDIRWLQARIASARLQAAVPVPQQVGFACVVALQDEQGRHYRYQIVGEDEADPEAGYISWLSPLARAIDGKERGDEVVWPRPAGDLVVEIMSIEAGEA